MALNRPLVDLLVCPKCRAKLALTDREDGLVCKVCKLAYPIVGEIPNMLVDEAIPLAEWPEKRPCKG